MAALRTGHKSTSTNTASGQDDAILDWTSKGGSKKSGPANKDLGPAPINSPPETSLKTTTPAKKTESLGKMDESDLNDLEAAVKQVRAESATVDLKSVGDFIITLRKQVTDHSDDASLRLKLGTYLYLAGDYEGAASEFRHVNRLKAQSVAGHALLARVLGEAGEPEASTLEFKRALSIAPGAEVVHYLFAHSLAARGEMSEAINEYRRAIGIKPTAAALTGLSESLIIMQDVDGAVKAARQAVSQEPNSSEAHVALTKALIQAGDIQPAIRTAREALLLNPNSSESHIAMARTLYATQKVDAAIEELKQAVSLDPLNAEARNDLGYALYNRGEVQNAVNEFRLSLRLNPRFTEARNNLEIAIFGLSGRKPRQGH
jgi:Flp pilus assembly protein TadD